MTVDNVKELIKNRLKEIEEDDEEELFSDEESCIIHKELTMLLKSIEAYEKPPKIILH